MVLLLQYLTGPFTGDCHEDGAQDSVAAARQDGRHNGEWTEYHCPSVEHHREARGQEGQEDTERRNRHPPLLVEGLDHGENREHVNVVYVEDIFNFIYLFFSMLGAH